MNAIDPEQLKLLRTLDDLVERLAEGLDVRCDHVVDRIEHGGSFGIPPLVHTDRLEITDPEGTNIWADISPEMANNWSRATTSAVPEPSTKNGRFSSKNTSNAERFTTAGSTSTCPKSGFTVAVSVSPPGRP